MKLMGVLVIFAVACLLILGVVIAQVSTNPLFDDENRLNELLGESTLATDTAANESVEEVPTETAPAAAVNTDAAPAGDLPNVSDDLLSGIEAEAVADSPVGAPVVGETPAVSAQVDPETQVDLPVAVETPAPAATHSAPVDNAVAAPAGELPNVSDDLLSGGNDSLLSGDTMGLTGNSGSKTDDTVSSDADVQANPGGNVPGDGIRQGELPSELPLSEAPLEALEANARQVAARKAQEIQALRDIELGKKAFAYKAYQTALGHFLNAEKNLPNRIETTQAKQQIAEGCMMSEYFIALEKLTANELTGDQGAMTYARRSVARNRKFTAGKRLIDRIESRIKEQSAQQELDGTRRASHPDFKEKIKRIEQLLRVAEQHMRVNELNEAEAKSKMVLAIDPMNYSASDLLREIARRREKMKKSERESMIHERIADVAETWVPRDYTNYIPSAIELVTTVKPMTETESDRMRQKMDQIVIPEINFSEANIRDVVIYLQDQSRFTQDKSDPQKRGVNIILNIPQDQVGAKTITFNAKYVSLMDAIKIVCEVSGLKYRLDKNAVMIVPSDTPDADILTRVYSVDRSVITAMTSGNTAGGGLSGQGLAGPSDGGGDGFIPLPSDSGGGGGESASDLKTFLASVGVTFPRGSSITYVANPSRIIHVNTSANLALFERILSEFDETAPQVEIETRFVDISQDDLNELGLQWLLTDDYKLLKQKGSNINPLATPRVVLKKSDLTKGLRFGQVGVSANAVSGGSANSFLTFQSVLTNPELTMLVHAIEQNDRANLLSAPRVTTQSGEEATVKVTQEYIYPTEYRVEGGGLAGSTTTGGSVLSTPIVLPESFETREVGVILTVRPDVSPDQKIITLMLQPDVVTEPTWEDYGYTLPDGSHIPMRMPFFHRRTATTTVKVYDGATVVMGGLISERLQTIDDKVPFLGNLPLVGRLFTDKQTKSEKRNLLLFVTARLVDPAGRPVKDTRRIGAEISTQGAAAPVSEP